jgi:hypothetical protein
MRITARPKRERLTFASILCYNGPETICSVDEFDDRQTATLTRKECRGDEDVKRTRQRRYNIKAVITKLSI